jgi:mycothiol synthase
LLTAALKRRRRILVKIREIATHEVRDIAMLCARELVLDRQAGSIPGILARRAHIGLVAIGDDMLLGCCFGSASQETDVAQEGFIDLLVVDRAVQRRGVGRLLASTMERQLATRGCTRINLAGNGPHYAWPGIDIHYTSAICFAEDCGYKRQGCEVNMDVDLGNAALDTGPAEDRLSSLGIEIRRASSADDGPLQESLGSTWQPGWITEIVAALRASDSGVHIAVQGTRYFGFCAYGVNRLHEVGPVGTSPDLRKLGIGEVLLKRCLAEQRNRGVTSAELVWAGPLSYFSSTLNATIGRAFWQYEKNLEAADPLPGWQDRIGLI